MIEVFLIIISVYFGLGIVVGIASRFIGVDGSNSHKDWEVTFLLMPLWPLYIMYLVEFYKWLKGKKQ